MTTICRLAALMLAALLLPLPSAAQEPRPQKVFLSGENPYLALRDTPDGPAVARASFWRIHYSPVGTGHVCFVTVGEQGKPGAVRVALTDSAPLTDYLIKEVLATFDKSYVEWPFTTVAGATFGRSGDAKSEHREICKGPGYDVVLSWRDLQTPGLVDILAGSRPANPFGITYLRIPAGSATMTINGTPAPGRSVPAGSFLAFGETWIK
ncbi:MAG: hypothetical protein ABIT71_12705 [Vicinamibacteraceae bacterium]